MTHIHTIPVDASLTPAEAWNEIRLFHRRITYTDGPITWANIDCGGDCGE